jgi:hypothetical protein
MWRTLIVDIIKALLTGELQAWLKERKEAGNAQAIANTPTTNKEWTNAAEKGDL